MLYYLFVVGPAVIAALTGLSGIGAFLLYVVVFDGLWGLVLFRKLERYRAAYDAVGADDAAVRSAFQFGSE